MSFSPESTLTSQRVIHMRYILLSLAICLSQLSLAQTTDQEAINKDVWYNFMQAYQDLDAGLFNRIHTDDVIRVPVDGNAIYIGQEYKDRNLENFNRWNGRALKQKIEFSFINRVVKGDWAYEIGIYKLTRYNGGQSKSYYGKFNVTLKKVDGLWKIFLDSDTNEGDTIDEADFQAGSILSY